MDHFYPNLWEATLILMLINQIWYSWLYLKILGNIACIFHEVVFISDNLSILIFYMKPNNAVPKDVSLCNRIVNQKLKQNAQTHDVDPMQAFLYHI